MMFAHVKKRTVALLGLLGLAANPPVWAALPTPVAPSTAPAAGDWIAFRIDAYVFDPYSNVIGWLPFDTPDVFDLSGSWMGTIQPDGRFFAPRRVEHRRAP